MKSKIIDEATARSIFLSRTGKIVWVISRTLLLLSLTYVILYPLIFMVSLSLRSPQDILDPTVVWIPKNFTLQNFVLVDTAIDFFSCFKNSVLISVIGSVINVFICAVTGYGLARFRVYGKSVFMAIVIFLIIIPQQMLSLSNYLLFLDYSLIDNPLIFLILAVFGMGMRSGIFILIFIQFFKGMQREIENAALVDGCGFIGIFFKIMLPNAKNIVLVTFIFSLVWYWNDYYQAAIYMPTIPTLSTALANIQTSLTSVMNVSTQAFDPYNIITLQQAGCLAVILPILIVYIFTQRFLTESIENSGIVG